MKTAEEVFTSGLVESDLNQCSEYLQYNGKYYSLTGERIPLYEGQDLDDRFFILTLFGIGKELEGTYTAPEGYLPASRTSGGTASSFMALF